VHLDVHARTFLLPFLQVVSQSVNEGDRKWETAMSDMPPARPASPPPAASPSTGQRLGRWAGIVVGIVVGIGGLAKLYGAFTLPGCDSSRMTDTLRTIYQKQKVEVKGFRNIKTVSSSFSEVTCTGEVEIADEYDAINFRSYWDGWTPQVRVSSSLPSCESKRTAESLQNIFKERKIAINRIYDLKTVTSTPDERTCTGQVEAPGELATINFRVFRKDNITQVLITEVKSQPK